MEETGGDASLGDSQESIDVVPESPPMYTQDGGEDVEAQVSESLSNAETLNETTIKFDNENSSRPSCSKDAGKLNKSKEFVIDIEEEMFPDDDDQILLTVSTPCGSELQAELEFEKLLELENELAEELKSQVNEEISEDVRKAEDSRKKQVEKFRKFKPLDKIFPDVRLSEHNTIAFRVLPNYTPGDPLTPMPQRYSYAWEQRFVMMPFCTENIAIVRTKAEATAEADNDGENNNEDSNEAPAAETEKPNLQKVFLWERIQTAFQTAKILCSQDFVTVCKRFTRVPEEFKALDYCLNQVMDAVDRMHFINAVVPFMVNLVECSPEIVTCPVPFLRKNLNHNISFTQHQVACLLANAFFSTLPRRCKFQAEAPSINFKELFAEEDEKIMKVKAEKIRCLIHYFSRIHAEMPQGVVTYSRKNLRHSNLPDWDKVDKGLTKLVPLFEGTIEKDGDGMLKVDFANSFIGGGALGRGAVQEEILFMIYPELIISRLFTAKLNSNEAVVVTGCERFSKYVGYSYGFRFDGDFQDTTPYDSKGRRCTQIVAIDALYINRPSFQYHPKHVLRELNKAYVGFHSPIPSPVAVATGKWGCGAFNGDFHLKTIIQWLAASHAGRDLVLFTFGDVNGLTDIVEICQIIQDYKIKEVWNLLKQYHSIFCTRGKITTSVKEFLVNYANGATYAEEKAEAARQASSSRSSGQMTITSFYPAERKLRPDPLDDANVAAITNGINRINTPKKQFQAPGKRTREDEADGLSEQEIEFHLTGDDDLKSDQGTDVPSKESKSGASTPASTKKSRLVDFYEKKDS